MKTNHTSIFLSIALLVLAFVAEGGGLTAAAEDTTPRWFQRITTMEEITEDGVYLIGANSPDDGNFYLMSSEKWKKNWLKAEAMCDSTERGDIMSCDNDSCLWSFAHNSADENGGWIIKKATDCESLYVTKGTYLYHSSNQYTTWKINCSIGVYSIWSDVDYRITLTPNTKKGQQFGNYNDFHPTHDSYHIYLYKAISDDVNDADARAVLMKDSASMAICSKMALATSDLSSMSFDGYLLQDGTVAEDDGVGEWIYENRTDSCFVLKNKNGRSLGYDLQPCDEERVWRVSNGRIVTNDESESITPRALCYDGNFKLVNVDSIKAERRVRLREVVKADSVLSYENKQLTGGWSKKRLAAVSWDGVNSLDLTSLSLPVAGLSDFAHRPSEANTIIYIGADDRELIPSDWNFVVTRSAEGDSLLTETTLCDRQPLRVARDIAYSARQISYRRELFEDTGWETLYLPFDIKVTGGYQLCTFKSLEGETLTFKTTDAAPAYTPVLLRRSSDASDTSLALTATSDGKLYSTPAASGSSFVGTLVPIEFSAESESGGVYLLGEDGQSFVRIGENCSLKPFRAYISTSLASQTLRLQFGETPTAVERTALSDEDTTLRPCFSIDGRLIAPLLTRKAVQQLPRGIYIYNGQTIITK